MSTISEGRHWSLVIRSLVIAKLMITTLVYREHKLAEQNPPPDTLAAIRAEPATLLWVDLSDPSEKEIKEVLETAFGFHSLAIEDCVSDSPFPKLEPYDDYLYLVMHGVECGEGGEFRMVELDLFLGKNYLVTYHRVPLHSVNQALDRFKKAPTLTVQGADRFAYTILDNMVEGYRPALDALRGEIERLEQGVLESISANELFPKVVALRKKLSRLRQIVRPQRQIALDLAQGKHRLIRSVVLPYLRDLSEELARIESQTGIWSEQLILSFRIFLNKSSHEANEGVRVLTGITALSFPALVVAGWYGMNFTNMHELSAHHGYPVAAALTLSGTYAMWLFMRRRRWL